MGRKRASTATRPVLRGPGILKLALLALAFCLIAIVAAGGSALRFENDVITGENPALARASARLAGELHGRARLVELAASSPDLAAAFRDRSLSDMESRLAAEIPDVLGVRLFPPGTARLNGQGVPAIGYSALELIRRAEEGAAPAVEIQGPGSGQESLVVVRPVRSDGAIVGTIVVAFDPELIAEAFRVAAIGGGYYELRQAGSPVLASAGAKDSALQSAPVREMVAGTAFEMTLTPSAPTGPAETSQGMLLLVLLGGIALAVAAAFIGLALILRRLLRRDLAQLAQFVERRAADKPTTIAMRLVEVQAFAIALRAQPRPEPHRVEIAAELAADRPLKPGHEQFVPGALYFMDKGVEVEEVPPAAAGPADTRVVRQVVAEAAQEPPTDLPGPKEADLAEVVDATPDPELGADAGSSQAVAEEALEGDGGDEADNLLEFEFDMEAFQAARADEPVPPVDSDADDGHSVTFELDPALLEGMDDAGAEAPPPKRKKEEDK